MPTVCGAPCLLYAYLVVFFAEPDLSVAPLSEDLTDVMFGDSNTYSSCKIGTRTYSNGQTFTPEIGPFGHYMNVNCKCLVSFPDIYLLLNIIYFILLSAL